jgi:hypothetical protein
VPHPQPDEICGQTLNIGVGSDGVVEGMGVDPSPQPPLHHTFAHATLPLTIQVSVGVLVVYGL